jgi:hypothetical protein
MKEAKICRAARCCPCRDIATPPSVQTSGPLKPECGDLTFCSDLTVVRLVLRIFPYVFNLDIAAHTNG